MAQNPNSGNSLDARHAAQRLAEDNGGDAAAILAAAAREADAMVAQHEAVIRELADATARDAVDGNDGRCRGCVSCPAWRHAPARPWGGRWA